MYISLSPIFLLNNELICVNINIAMKILKEEIANLKKELEIDFIDPIEGDVLKHFILNGSKFIRAKLVLLYLKFHLLYRFFLTVWLVLFLIIFY